MKDEFEHYFNEIENFSMRSERFFDAFKDLDTDKQKQIIRWMKGAFEAGYNMGYNAG